MALRLVAAPVAEPVTLEQAKAALRYSDEAFDVTLWSALRSARQEIDGADGWLGRAIMTQTWDLVLDGFPAAYASCQGEGSAFFWDGYRPSGLCMPLPPCQSIVSITYKDAAGVALTLSPAEYRLVDRGTQPSVLEPVTFWPTSSLDTGNVVIRFICGWTSSDFVPEPIKMWIVARAGTFMAQPEMLSMGVQSWRVPTYDTMLASLKVRHS